MISEENDMTPFFNLPLSIYNRALELCNQPMQDTVSNAIRALNNLSNNWEKLDAFRQAIIEDATNHEDY